MRWTDRQRAMLDAMGIRLHEPLHGTSADTASAAPPAAAPAGSARPAPEEPVAVDPGTEAKMAAEMDSAEEEFRKLSDK